MGASSTLFQGVSFGFLSFSKLFIYFGIVCDFTRGVDMGQVDSASIFSKCRSTPGGTRAQVDVNSKGTRQDFAPLVTAALILTVDRTRI